MVLFVNAAVFVLSRHSTDNERLDIDGYQH